MATTPSPDSAGLDESPFPSATLGLARMIAALGAGLNSGRERHLPAIFERELGRLVSAREVRLREVPARYHARLVTPMRSANAVVLGVPTSDARSQAVLEATLPAHRSFGDSELQLLAAAAQLGGLVLQASRPRSPGVPRPCVVEPATPLIGSSDAMRALRDLIDRVASTDFTVLIEGESGSGKELVARQLHELSRRRKGPFVAVNCAAVVDTLVEAELFGIEDRTATGVRGRRGKFEHADGGTLFLDEVSDLSPAAQAKLLRVVQDMAVERVGATGATRVDTRMVVATNRPLAALVEQGLFRRDLYFRLSGVEVHVPPLRARGDDVLELAAHFLARHRRSGNALSVSRTAGEALRTYAWPGNVRELERFIERWVALGASDEMQLSDVPTVVRGDYDALVAGSLESRHSLRLWAGRYARFTYERCGRNKRRTCRVLGVSYHTLRAYLRRAAGELTTRSVRRSTSSPLASPAESERAMP